MYGWTQECKRQQELNCEQQDLEKRLAELYGTVEGGADACADLTAPRARTLLLTGEVRPPRLLLGGSEPQKYLTGPAPDIMALGQAALLDDFCSTSQTAVSAAADGAIQAVPKPALLYNKAIGVEPASKTRHLLGNGAAAPPDNDIAPEKLTPLAFRDMDGVD